MEIEGGPKKRGFGKIALVADDTPFIRKMIVAAFLAEGFKKCAEAETGKQAIEVGKKIKPDVIVLDLSMPVMNGLEATSELRRIFPTTPIILFSFYADQASREDASNAGASLLLPKSVSLSDLIEQVYKLMNDT